MTGWWIGDLLAQGRATELTARLFWVIVSICLHELGHGWAALKQGDTTPRDRGHMTINPIVHMGWFSLIMLVVVGFTWGAMPVNPSRFRSGRLGEFLVAGAGPLVNFILAFACFTTLGVLVGMQVGIDPASGSVSNTVMNLHQFLMIGGVLNVVLFAFNLIPVPPLDGSTMLASLSATTYRLMHQPALQQFGILGLLLLLLPTGLGGALFEGARFVGVLWISIVAAPF